MNGRVRDFLSRLILVLTTVLGLLKLLLPPLDWEVWLIFIVLIGAVSGGWAWLSTKPKHIHEGVILEEIEEDVILEVPATYDMLVQANKHAKSIYGRGSPSLDDVEKWWNRNPFVEAVLHTKSGEYLGYFDVLPLTDDGAKLVECGKIHEREIPTTCILSPVKMKEAKTLYLAGFAVKDSGTEKGKMIAAKLFYGLACYIEHYFGMADRRILALAATPDGERILKAINAKLICPKDIRKDKYDLYEIMLTSSLLLEIKSRALRRAKPPVLMFKPITEY